MGFFSYYLFNIGVHENHLFVCMTLAFVLAAINPASGRPQLVYLTVIANLNLLLVYGIQGPRIMLEGVRGHGLLDGVGMTWASVLFSIVNTIFGAACLWQVAQVARRDGPALLASKGRNPAA